LCSFVVSTSAKYSIILVVLFIPLF
jgi:hypothetical protein